MILDVQNAKEIASNLLQINAIKLQPEQAFTWASGWKSPIYCDNRLVLSYPKVRQLIANQFADIIRSTYPDAQVIAGVATGAIGMGMLVASILDLPFIYVRPEPKKHGRQNQIEGISTQSKKVVVIEDLISTGKSSLNAVQAIQKDGGQIQAMLAIFTYGFTQSVTNFSQANISLTTLCNYDVLLLEALSKGIIKEDQLTLLSVWKDNPSQWQPAKVI